MPSSEHDALLEAFSDGPGLPFEWDAARAQFDENYGAFPVPDVAREPVSAGGVAAEWFRGDASARRAIVYVHGGGFCLGSITSHAPLTARIAEACGIDVLALDYRLAPEHSAPSQTDDVLAAYRWLLENDYPAQGIALAGDSAGAGVALSALQALPRTGMPMAAAAALMSGVYDLGLTSSSAREFAETDPLMPRRLVRQMFEAYRGELDVSDPAVSPALGRFDGLPPLLLMVGSTEVLRDDSVAVAERARAAGVDVQLDVEEGLLHVWPHYAHLIPEGRAGVNRVAAFLAPATVDLAARP